MTYCPPTAVPKLLSNPLIKEVRGRGLKESRECACTVMWSMMICPKNFSDFQPNHFVLLRKKSEIPNVFIDLTDVENEVHGGVDDEHQVHINKNDGDDGLLGDPQTNDDTNDESSHDGLLDDPQTNDDTNDERNENQTLPVLGSDEEKAMRIAMAKAFPDTQRLACVPHIEAKLLVFMQDKIGMLQNQRTPLKFQLFQLVTSAMDHIDPIDSLCDFESKITQKKLADPSKTGSILCWWTTQIRYG
ncbi:hypothetical protein PoB_005027900 [Plakobranchus ocellatus]|uniref:MULE transposase domain-containing protein n=1 Tax=Plakobranchus ocellatus TaxID=259542 RepID=A0AAV4BZF6_9GAST|nr:hypothetical protein PoB_005027900 [Plakobranchus ocellatus]